MKLRRTKVNVEFLIEELCGLLVRGQEPSEKNSYHDGIDDVVVVVLQGAYCLRPRHVGLWHDQLDVLDLNAGLVNLLSENGVSAL